MRVWSHRRDAAAACEVARAVRCNLVRGSPEARTYGCAMTGRILRMSTLFVRTLRDDPNDAEVPSHRLLVRAGYIRRAAPGIYTWLPLGLRVLRQHRGHHPRGDGRHRRPGAARSPRCCPRSPTRRPTAGPSTAPNIFRLQDRKGADYLLGPTHEEMFTLVVKDLYSSYKDLPLSIYQIQTKYRDEARPRAGLLRGREFVMKDSYSFDIDDAGLEASLPAAPRRLRPDLRPARLRVRHRQGDVRRDGRLGQRGVPRQGRGRRGHLRPLHPLRLRRQRRGRRRCARPRPWRTTTPPPRTRRTRPARPPSTRSSTTSTRRSPATTAPGRPATRSRTCWSCSSTPTAPASRSPSACPATARSTRSASRASSSRSRSRPWTRPSFAKHPALVKGYIGPGALGEESASGIRYLVDPRVVEGTRWVTGADVHGCHVIDLVVGRDFTARRHHRGRRRARRRRLPQLPRGHARVRPRHRDGPHLPARPQVRRGARPQGARRERQAGHRHHGLLRHRSLARRGRDRRGHPRRDRACAGRATSRRPTSTSSPRARTRRSSRPPSELARDLGRRARGAARRPHRQGQPRREVQGRRADRRARPS